MAYRKTQYFGKKIFSAGELASTLDSFMKLNARDLDYPKIRYSYDLPDGTRSSKDAKISELNEVCDLASCDLSVSFFDKSNDWASLALTGSGGHYSIEVGRENTPDIAETFNFFRQRLGLEEEPSPLKRLNDKIESGEFAKEIADSVERVVEEDVVLTFPEIGRRLERLEDVVFEPTRLLHAFLSFRFSPETEVSALRLQQYLHLLDVKVLTGSTYEPRRVTDKVLERLRSPLDFIILLVGVRGESMWTRDEIAWALAKDIPVIPLVESGAQFQSGLFGDLEYIEFSEGHIGDAFFKILEAVHFIRSSKSVKNNAPFGKPAKITE